MRVTVGEGCETVTERAASRELDELEALALRLDETRGQPEDFIELDVRFHLRIAGLSGNDPLQAFLASVFRGLAAVRARYPIAYGDMDRAIDYQLDTVAALRSGDPDRVLASMDRHLHGLEGHFLGRGIVLRRPAATP